MRDPARIDRILSVIKEIWEEHPDLRLTQILVCALKLDEPVPFLFYAEDDRLEQQLKDFRDGKL